jgi:hypothetical protein
MFNVGDVVRCIVDDRWDPNSQLTVKMQLGVVLRVGIDDVVVAGDLPGLPSSWGSCSEVDLTWRSIVVPKRRVERVDPHELEAMFTERKKSSPISKGDLVDVLCRADFTNDLDWKQGVVVKAGSHVCDVLVDGQVKTRRRKHIMVTSRAEKPTRGKMKKQGGTQ